MGYERNGVGPDVQKRTPAGVAASACRDTRVHWRSLAPLVGLALLGLPILQGCPQLLGIFTKPPDIRVMQLGVEISSSGSFDIGSLAVGTSMDTVFTIQNVGRGELTLTGSPAVQLIGTDASMFGVSMQPAYPIGSGSSTSFSLLFSPTSMGAKTATVSIPNDDPDENPYTFIISGTATAAPGPEIGIKQGSADIPSQSGSYDFGSVAVGSSSSEILFTVQNLGSENLSLTGTPVVQLTGTDASMFGVLMQPSHPVGPGSSTSFSLVFTPTGSGARIATVSIPNNDSDENPYTFTVSGTATAASGPEIDIRQGSTGIPSGAGSHDFGSVVVGSSSSAVTFTAQNLGSLDLTLTGTPPVQVSGTDAAMFGVGTQAVSPVSAGGSTSFTLVFTPGGTGAKTATVSIWSNDPDESPYTFTVLGNGTASPEPEINIKQGTTNISSGTGSYDFGSVVVSGSSSVVTFTVQNLGSANLSLTGAPAVQISGTHASLFAVGSQPVSPVSAGGSTSFTMTFTPDSLGAKAATVSISNNDSDENPYSFSVSGTGTAAPVPEINVRRSSTDIPDGTGSYAYTDTVVGSYRDVVFTIQNLGTGNLSLPGSPKVEIGGADASQFSVTVQPSSPVIPSGSTTFTVRFAPTATGAKNATVSIANDDADENPYDFGLSGTGTAPEINVRQGSTDIPDDTGSYAYASVLLGAYTDVVFTIQNLGSANLNLTGSPAVQLGGADSSQFSVTVQPSSPVYTAGTRTFTVRFSPTTAGAKSATLTIPNDDADENPYNFSLSGTGTAPEPWMWVKQGTTNIADDTGSYTYADAVVNTYWDVVFTIQNFGTGNLSLTGSPKVEIGGADASQFSVTVQPSSPVGPGGATTSFTVRFAPTSWGAKAATVSIANDDADQNPYNFGLSGLGLGPEMNVKQGGTGIADGSGSYTYADTMVSVPTNVVFTIENLGNANLNFTGSPHAQLGGTNPTEFSVTGFSSDYVTPGGSTTFTLWFAPKSEGAKSATVSIANNDSDENPYDFALTGTSVEWHGVKTLDSFGISGDSTSIAVDGSNLYLSYRYFNDYDLMFTKSSDNGNTWLLSRKTVDSTANVGEFTSIADAGSSLYIAYYDNSSGGLKVAKSTDSGDTWPAGDMRTLGILSGGYIAADGSNVYLSYSSSDLSFVKSTDSGNTWPSGNIRVVDSVGSGGPLISDGNNVYISYRDYTNADLKFAKSTDGGDTWPAGDIRTVDSAGDVGLYKSMAASGTSLFISYYDNTNGDLKFAKSTDAGNTWPAGAVKIVDSSGNVGMYSSIAVDGSNVYISYYDSTNGDLKCARSTDGGATWPSADIKTPATSGDVGTWTSIGVAGSRVYISYYDVTTSDLRLAKSLDGGDTW